jgi:hypothetical protein
LARASFRYLYRRRRNFGRIKNQRSQRATRCCKREANVLTPEAVEVVREAYRIVIIWFISHESHFAHIRPKAIAVRFVEVRALVGTIELALAASPTTARRRTEVRGMALMAVQRLRKLVSAPLEEPGLEVEAESFLP